MHPNGPDVPFHFSPGDAAVAGTAASSTSDEDPLLRQTRREIKQIVQEISALCRSEIPEHRFWPSFLTQLGAALAADAALLWKRDGRGWSLQQRCGAVDSRLFAADSADDCHQRMIAEVGDSAGPVVVPPGAAWDDSEPGNPTDRLAAVVPVPIDADKPVDRLIELFIAPGGSPATQRGYLRFTAQMADLAADYLRQQRLRTLQGWSQLAESCDGLFSELSELSEPQALMQQLVDGTSRLFAAERVSLVACSSDRTRVLAVSGVDHIKPHCAAVTEIAALAVAAAPDVGFHPAACSVASPPASGDAPADRPAAASAEDRLLQTGRLHPRGVLVLSEAAKERPGSSSPDSLRIVVEDIQPRERPEFERSYWPRFARQADLLLRAAMQRRSKHRLAAWSSRPGTPGRWLMPSALALICLLTALLPVPLVVTAAGQLQPRDSQTVYAPQDGTVAELLVEHGQAVTAGTPLLRLVNHQLQRRLGQLSAELEVQQQEAAELQRQLVEAASHELDTIARVRSELNINHRLQRGLREELAVLQQQVNELTLVSDRAGTVDAWQIDQHLAGRPVQRGQQLLRVLSEHSRWEARVEIPQHRLDHVLRRGRDRPVDARLVMTAYPQQTHDARLRKIGPARSETAAGAPSAGLALFDIDANELPLLQPGAPVELGIPCGYRPLIYVLGQDLWRASVSTLRLYW